MFGRTHRTPLMSTLQKYIRLLPIQVYPSSCFLIHIFPTNICSLGELTLVFEPGDQSYLCSSRNIATAMGMKISQGYPVTLQSAQASTNSCVPCQRNWETFPLMDSGSTIRTSPHFPVPILCWPCCFPLERWSHNFQVGAVVGQCLHSSLQMHHVHANLPSRQLIHPSLVSSVAHCYCNMISGFSDSSETNILDIFQHWNLSSL